MCGTIHQALGYKVGMQRHERSTPSIGTTEPPRTQAVGLQSWLNTGVPWAGYTILMPGILSRRAWGVALGGIQSFPTDASRQHTWKTTTFVTLREFHYTWFVAERFPQRPFQVLKTQRWGGPQCWDTVSQLPHTLCQLKWSQKFHWRSGGLVGSNLICLQLITRKNLLQSRGSTTPHQASGHSQAAPSSWALFTKQTWAPLPWNAKLLSTIHVGKWEQVTESWKIGISSFLTARPSALSLPGAV